MALGWRILGVVVLFAVGVAAGYFVYEAVDGSSSTTATTTTTAPPVALTVTNVETLDPSPGDGRENSDEVGNVTDGDPATTWSTESYASADLGGKGGVGLQFTLDGTPAVAALEADTTAGPWSAELYLSDTAFDGVPTGKPAATGTGLGTTAALRPTRPTTAGFALLWITSLPETGTGDNPYQLTITGARLLGG